MATNNAVGIQIYTVVAGGSTKVAISNSIASNNNNQGILAANDSNALAVSIDNTSATGNGKGIEAIVTPNVTLGRSVITGNVIYGIVNETTPNTFYSYGDNRINGNGTVLADDINGTMPISDALK